MSGKLYGIGVGPGDPELMTLKAVRVIKESDIIVLPSENPKETVAYKIALPVCPEMKNKEIVGVPIVMTKDADKLEESYTKSTQIIAKYLDEGKNVAYLTLGDATIYATYVYIHKKILDLGYETEIVSGIPSFCSVAARLNMSLVERSEMLHIIPASYQIEEALKLSGTKVLMKAASKMKEVKEQLKKANSTAVMIENCGMPNEKVYNSLDEIPDSSGYYSLIIVKDKGEV
ncbi:MAG: precorrin-2 C(20)-methyltransferase [Epulopiscium sp. Nuni2H_MBin003]|nr:MAG: precorrin-2 C(20)-methyltransferase [Epulopiscium sp. Nuni2H_MBin003]